jgi:hypothetical protein
LKHIDLLSTTICGADEFLVKTFDLELMKSSNHHKKLEDIFTAEILKTKYYKQKLKTNIINKGLGQIFRQIIG